MTMMVKMIMTMMMMIMVINDDDNGDDVMMKINDHDDGDYKVVLLKAQTLPAQTVVTGGLEPRKTLYDWSCFEET